MKPSTICFIFGALTLTSIFLWAAFDVRWWVPVEPLTLREFMLFLIHVWGLFVGAIAFPMRRDGK